MSQFYDNEPCRECERYEKIIDGLQSTISDLKSQIIDQEKDIANLRDAVDLALARFTSIESHVDRAYREVKAKF